MRFRSCYLAAAILSLLATAAPAQDQAVPAPVTPAAPDSPPALPYIPADLGLTQHAWENPQAGKAPNQKGPGYLRYTWTPESIFPLRIRDGVITSIRLPETEVVQEVFLGDRNQFEAKIARTNLIMLRPKAIGVDGNLTAVTRSGNIYTFWLKSEGNDAQYITDVTVDVVLGEMGMSPVTSHSESFGGTASGFSQDGVDTATKDYLRAINFDPSKVVHDLEIYLPDEESASLAPERVFRDQAFTYLDFGEKAGAMNEWPTVLLVVQGVEEPVPFRTIGDRNQMIVVEAIGDLSLRNGQKVVCIKRKAESSTETAAAPIYTTPGQSRLTSAPATQSLPQPAPIPAPASMAPGFSPPSAPIAARFMLDLAGGFTEADLNGQWQGLAQSYPELKALRPNFVKAATIGAPDSRYPMRLLAGPVGDIASATRLCETLAEAGIACSLLREP